MKGGVDMNIDEALKLKFDDKCRIAYVPLSSKIMKGHSVCNECKKDMPICWDIVCYYCRKTFCFDHAHLRESLWYCPNCYNATQYIIERDTYGTAWRVN